MPRTAGVQLWPVGLQPALLRAKTHVGWLCAGTIVTTDSLHYAVYRSRILHVEVHNNEASAQEYRMVPNDAWGWM